ncbi:MAG: ferritin-like domain-containing protein [Bacteroidota bacterium]|nr:ferritin-like domain-containing protein [Bacteroidota bacterium]
MNLQNIISEIEKTDPEVYDKLDTRRKVMKDFAKVSGKIALASIPFALGSMFQKAYGSPTSPSDIVIDTLNFALTLEYLESNFYIKAVASGIVPSGDALNAFTVIRDHENEHVNFLKTAITAAGATPVSFTAASFDYTAKGTFPGVFTDYGTLLAVAQTFEDTGVRAYKGQAPNLMSQSAYLTAALQIHSVEARHAAHIREMRKAANLLVPAGVNVKPWITLNQSGIGSAAVQASYNGEENVVQAGVTITNIGGFPISAAAASEAFDEPLTKDQVTAIVTPFFA